MVCGPCKTGIGFSIGVWPTNIQSTYTGTVAVSEVTTI